ncbi:MAG: FHA domain-containing protein [Deltaproteobacteria bacterium]|nr:FHA domain-containing protein [Deltaproteobacteria bacterium]
MRRDLTIVVQRMHREIDGTSRDGKTCIAYVFPVEPEPVRLERGARELIMKTREGEGVHYGMIDHAGRLASHGSMLARDKVETVSIGRHSHADLRGATDDFALRHALLVRRPERADELFWFDLGGDDGTCDLAGRRIGSATLDLPCALRLGSHLFVAFSADQANLGALGIAELSRASFVRANAPAKTAAKFVYTLEDVSIREPSSAGTQLPRIGEDQTFSSPLRQAVRGVPQIVFRPSADALARGFMLGRYERCGAPGTLEWEQRLSRVHALLFSIGDASYIADLGSTNGTRHETLGEVRLKHLCDGDVLWLGDTRLRVGACSIID